MRVYCLAPLLFATVAACANDPIYIDPGDGIPAGLETDMEGEPVPGKASLLLPIEKETADDIKDREALQADLPADVVVPYVRVGDLEVSVEWTIKSYGDMPGTAFIQINGANQFYEYDPEMIVLSEDEEAPKTPGLSGDIPIDVAPGQTVSGLFTEDDMREASIDLDQITRGRVNPFRARFTIAKSDEEFAQLTEVEYDDEGEALPQMTTGVVFPREVFAQMLRLDLVFSANRHMGMNFNVRVRDVRGKIINKKLSTAPADELQYVDPYAAENGFYTSMPPAPGAMN